MKNLFDPGTLEKTRILPTDVTEELPVDGIVMPGTSFEKNERVEAASHRFSVGYAEMVGFRDSMEDKMVIHGAFGNKTDQDYFAIFDGHAGKDASLYCSKYLHQNLLQKLQESSHIPTCMIQSFADTHENMKSLKNEKGTQIESGTTALVALFHGSDLYIANAGDSRAVFYKNKTGLLITEDHKPTIEREITRICSIEGGFVIKNRVQGKLAVARSIGDFKWNPYVTHVPDVYGPYLWTDPQYEFLILACDGLWDVIDEHQACDTVCKSRDPRDAAIKLRNLAYSERSRDNISVLVIWFPGFTPDQQISMPEMDNTNSESTSEASGESEESVSEEEDNSAENGDENEEENKQEKEKTKVEQHSSTTGSPVVLLTPPTPGSPTMSRSPSIPGSPGGTNSHNGAIPQWKLDQMARNATARARAEKELLAKQQKIQGIAQHAMETGNPSVGITYLAGRKKN